MDNRICAWRLNERLRKLLREENKEYGIVEILGRSLQVFDSSKCNAKVNSKSEILMVDSWKEVSEKSTIFHIPCLFIKNTKM